MSGNQNQGVDYASLLKTKKVVESFPQTRQHGEVLAVAGELLSGSDFDKVYRIGPVLKNKPLHGLRKQVLSLADKKPGVSVICVTRVLEDGSYLFFKKTKKKEAGQ